MQKSWSLLFAAVNLAALLLFAIAPSMGWWLPELHNADSFGYKADALFYFILIATGIFFVLTELILVYCMWKYTYDPEKRATYTHGNHRLEMVWTLVPGILLVIIAVVQIPAWAEIKYERSMPKPDQLFDVSARQFEWRMRYPTPETQDRLLKEWEAGNEQEAHNWGHNRRADIDDFHTVNEVHTWKGANVRLYLSSRDVLHSFFLPNMRLKQDAVPGKVIQVWFKSDDHNCKWDEEKEKIVGKSWPLACAELCGWGHYKMKGYFYVHETKESYLAWLNHSRNKQLSRSGPDAE